MDVLLSIKPKYVKSISEGGKRHGRIGNGVSCPLCGHKDVHYRKETDTWVCGQCQYSWYTIEGCNLQS
jgi:ribosomal protein L37AE/L43A